MSGKLVTKRIKNYKPEIKTCPFCGSKLVYKHTVSNKIIQFSSGSYIRVKNLGYACSNEECENKSFIFSSQTASKLCVRGYTYSAKVLAMIYHYKEKHYSRDRICDMLAELGIQISDRNIDIIYTKYHEIMQIDYLGMIEQSYEKMQKYFKEIRIAIDFIRVEDHLFISIRDSFWNEQIGMHYLYAENEDKITNILKAYICDRKITYITTIRPQTKSFHFISELADKETKILFFSKE